MPGLQRSGGLAAAALLLALGLPGSAAAELYRCEGPDGQVQFSDNPGACPRAAAHEPGDRIQRVPSAPPPAAPRGDAGQRVLHEQAEADRERSWREKKRRAQHELAELERRRERVRELVVWCNRGGELYRRDDAGLKRKVSCGSVHEDLASLEEGIAHLSAYLEEGLEEECRRAGCLPGWIR